MATFYIDFENVHNAGTDGVDELSNKDYVFLFYSHNANTMNLDTVRHFMDSRCGVEFIEIDAGTPNALDFQLITFLYSGINQDDYHYIVSKDHGFDAAVKMGKRMGIENVKRFPTIAEALRHYLIHVAKAEDNEMSEAMESNEILDSTEENQTLEVQQILTSEEKQNEIEDSELENRLVSLNDENKCKKKLKDQIKQIVQKETNITLPRSELEISCEGIITCDNKLRLYHFLRKQLGNSRGRMVYNAINEEFNQLKLYLAG